MGERVAVRTYSGYKGDERPLSFSVGEQIFHIKEIIDRWYDVNHNYYKLRVDGGASYLLRHDLNQDIWELVEMGKGDPNSEAV